MRSPPGNDPSNDPGPLIRPYALTGGRTEARVPELAIEDLVSATEAGNLELYRLDDQHRAIVSACQQPVSVAEVSALAGLPLGVTRVLVSDLITAGLLQAHPHAADPDGRPSLELLERVLEGLQAL
jgi:Protein of unknown function (DUF742)